ncbi:sugar 3,4-ketoisomerase [Hymenobacter persicinus]|uniref:WxcM-like domain-containing protein n=1 Tax=Hymenobacter persicinus TaxID=2025506 RepID=A0A4Q5L910_9BACT|nr:FdtA/QdtA family cupin domain-containing protein [Hymenobacter persicinus]RYU76066.1 WxcM-like domain-containing protein [Hymenobacter persicinus]
MRKPYLLDFPKLGRADVGYMAVLDGPGVLPFEVKRLFWTYDTPEMIVRGRHAHHQTEQVLVAVAGRILVTTEMPDGEIQLFVLDSPQQGLYVPAHAWHTMQYSRAAVQLVLASTPYSEPDYIRDYATFKRTWGSAS